MCQIDEGVCQSTEQRVATNVPTIGIDEAKHTFSLHGRDGHGKVVFNTTPSGGDVAAVAGFPAAVPDWHGGLLRGLLRGPGIEEARPPP